MRKWLNISVILVLLMPCISRAQFDSISNYDFWTDLSDVEFLNDSVGFVVGSVGFTARAVILKTMDGGQNWDTVFGPSKKGSFKDISFATDSIGFVCGPVEVALPEPVGIYRTFDQGNTWDYCGDSITMGTAFEVVEFNSNGIGIASKLGGATKTFISYDWGNDWTEITNTGGPPVFSNVLRYDVSEKVNDTTFLMGVNSYFVTGNPETLQWTTSLLPFDYIRGIDAFGINSVIAAGYMNASPWNYGIAAVSNNGGVNWDFHNFEVDSLFRINAVEAVDSNNIFICGQLNYVMKSIDGGQTWLRIPRTNNWPELPNFSAMSCPSDSICYAVGPSGLIFKLSNGQDYVSSVSGLTLEVDFKLYPNPVSDLIHIELDNSSEIFYNISVSDIRGRVILHDMFSSSSKTINTSEWAKGVYNIVIYSEQGVGYKKIVKL